MFREVPEGHLAPPSAPAAPGSLALTAGQDLPKGHRFHALGKNCPNLSSLPYHGLGPGACYLHPIEKRAGGTASVTVIPDLLELGTCCCGERAPAQTRFRSRNFSHFSHRSLNVECAHQEEPYTGYLPSAPSFTHPLIISFIHSSIHVCTLTHTEKYGGQGLISERLSQSCLHLVSFDFITFMHVCM